jgi:hypothetical protein
LGESSQWLSHGFLDERTTPWCTGRYCLRDLCLGAKQRSSSSRGCRAGGLLSRAWAGKSYHVVRSRQDRFGRRSNEKEFPFHGHRPRSHREDLHPGSNREDATHSRFAGTGRWPRRGARVASQASPLPWRRCRAVAGNCTYTAARVAAPSTLFKTERCLLAKLTTCKSIKEADNTVHGASYR